MASENDVQPPAPGETAPDFEVTDSDGARQTLSALCQRRPQVLIFYRGHW
ncbi:MAG: hypothetical protein U1A78_27505 [Polyangia bacterium]